MDATGVSAVLIGLFGSAHCIGMCGGIVGALNSGRDRDVGAAAQFAHHITYNAGRLLSYTLAGVIAGAVGAGAARFSVNAVLPWGGLIGGAFMIALGLYLGGWWRAVGHLEKAGGLLWRHVQPIGRKFLPVNHPLHAFGLGMVWGWLPCGLVYSALALALLSGSPWQGGAIMLGFGMGTLPTLLVMGKAAAHMNAITRKPRVRQIAGGMVVALGVFAMMSAYGGHLHAMPPGDGMVESGPLSQARLAFSVLFDEICAADPGSGG